MQRIASSIFIFILLEIVKCTIFSSLKNETDRIKLIDIKYLTLYKDRLSTYRRLSPIQQLQCTSGCEYTHLPSIVNCYNLGWDGKTVQWECRAELDTNYKFGTIQISCEGYDYKGDEYVLVGSCGLEYSIESKNASIGTMGIIFLAIFAIIGVGIFGFCIYVAYRYRDKNYPNVSSHSASNYAGGCENRNYETCISVTSGNDYCSGASSNDYSSTSISSGYGGTTVR